MGLVQYNKLLSELNGLDQKSLTMEETTFLEQTVPALAVALYRFVEYILYKLDFSQQNVNSQW